MTAATEDDMIHDEINLRIAWSDLPAINSGALVQLRRRGEQTLTATVVEASASAHVSPSYEYAAEAPRVYGHGTTKATIRRAWLRWMYDVLYRGPSRLDSDPPAGDWMESRPSEASLRSAVADLMAERYDDLEVAS